MAQADGAQQTSIGLQDQLNIHWRSCCQVQHTFICVDGHQIRCCASTRFGMLSAESKSSNSVALRIDLCTLCITIDSVEVYYALRIGQKAMVHPTDIATAFLIFPYS